MSEPPQDHPAVPEIIAVLRRHKLHGVVGISDGDHCQYLAHLHDGGPFRLADTDKMQFDVQTTPVDTMLQLRAVGSLVDLSEELTKTSKRLSATCVHILRHYPDLHSEVARLFEAVRKCAETPPEARND